MKRIVKQYSCQDMIDAFNARIDMMDSSIESCSVTSSTWIDSTGLFGELDAQYTDEDLREYWNKCHDDDPVLEAWGNDYDGWYAATTDEMTRVEGSNTLEVYGSETIQGSLGRDDDYFGQTAANMYGDQITSALMGKTISKRRDLANQPGGLIYEAKQLGIEDFYHLLEALEGMCADGRAEEIDDSTYQIVSYEAHPVQRLFGSEVGDEILDVETGEWGTIEDQYVDEDGVTVVSDINAAANSWLLFKESPEYTEAFQEWQAYMEDAGYEGPYDEQEFEPSSACEDAYNLWKASNAVLGSTINASEDIQDWEVIDSKQVPDSDGFYTDYTLYYNANSGSYECIFGDKDVYTPENAYADFESQEEEAAREWFDNYEGFQDIDNATAITSSTIADNGQQVFQLMSYSTSPEDGIDGDDFYCYGEFFAADQADAEQQLADARRDYPEFFESASAYDIYVTEYNEYFASGDEIYSSVSAIIEPIATQQPAYEEDMPFIY